MPPQTISEAIGSDHKTINSYAENIKTAASLEEKIKWRNQFTWALARHAVSEELTMYPAMEKHMGQEGLDLTNVDREQHQAVSVARLPLGAPLIDRLVGQRRPLQTPIHVSVLPRILPSTRSPA